ncbi:hypothetical protein BGX31_007574 [Mortierella sp. GBA43]|nr:hypothetical protein BGX31_007574 [Mortierella sp. GBA43]
MLGPASLRSHQPSKTTLRTYGNRGKRASGAPAGATTLFQWDKLENERKARLEQREQERQAGKFYEDVADAELDAQLYSDPESEGDSAEWLDNARLRLKAPSSGVGKVPGTEAVRGVSATNQGLESRTESSSKLLGVGHANVEPQGYHEHSTSKPTRKVMFDEGPMFDEYPDDVDQNTGGDEVLFRTPSFQVLQKLKELPKPRPIEPRVNPFGFDDLSGTTRTTDRGKAEGRVSPTLPTNDPSMTTRKPSLESPSTKRSLDIFSKRTQQLAELQRHREQKSLPGSTMSGNETSMDIDPNHQKATFCESGKDASRGSPEAVSMKRGGGCRIQSTLFTHDTLESAPDPEVGRHQVVQDDCVDLALGKRMSSIQITPQRLHSKLRKTTSHDDISPFLPSTPSFPTLSDDPIAEKPTSRSVNLFLDRDIPKNKQDQEEDDFDELFRRARQNRKRSPLPSSPPKPPIDHYTGGRPTSPHSSLRNVHAGAMFKFSMGHHKSGYDKTAPFGLLHQQDPTRGTYPSPLFEEKSNPFIDPSTYNMKQKSRKATSLHIPSQESVITRPVIQQQQIPSTTPKSLMESLGSKHHASQHGSTLPPSSRPIRQVNDLLAISSQQFFDQFRNLDSNTRVDNDHHQVSGKEQQRSDAAGILYFETVLPECMATTVTKIGEASYSEVYTVDLPIAQCRRQKRHGRPSPKNHSESLLELFQSPKLNNYVKESIDENDHCLASRETTDRKDATAVKLVMKIIPFLHGEDDEHGRRTKGRRKSDSTLSTLEDIYREAMVSTQIMQDWKGFIGGFGTLIVKGKYPKMFLDAWDLFCEANGSESERPDMYDDNQLYCIILLPYGGIDLEHCPLANWKQAWTVLTQIASSLEPKEQAPFWFEHRDLHWGNILVKRTQQDHILFPKREPSRTSSSAVGTTEHENETQNDDHEGELFREVPTHGIVVQMIDFTLARVQGDKGNLIYMDLEKDQDLFHGQGDYQFDIYRIMRKQINRHWAASCPRTNLFWLHYIADKLLTEKKLKKPTKRLQASITKDDVIECWCYERVLAVSRMSLDRLDPSGKTPSATVLDILLHNRPS